MRRSLPFLRRIANARFSVPVHEPPRFIIEGETWVEKIDKINLTPHEEYIMIGKHMEKPYTGIQIYINLFIFYMKY